MYYSDTDWKNQNQAQAKKQKKLAKMILKAYDSPREMFSHTNSTAVDYVDNVVISDLNLCFLGLTNNRKAMQKKYPMVKIPKEKGVLYNMYNP